METAVSVLPTPNEEGPLLRAFSLSTAAVTTGRNAIFAGLLLLCRKLVTESGFGRRASRQENQRKHNANNLHAKSPFSIYITPMHKSSEGSEPARTPLTCVPIEPCPLTVLN